MSLGGVLEPGQHRLVSAPARSRLFSRLLLLSSTPVQCCRHQPACCHLSLSAGRNGVSVFVFGFGGRVGWNSHCEMKIDKPLLNQHHDRKRSAMSSTRL
ncbi:hypothetical protein SORBI_3009G134700 [Sorghum bicolor]|uniref:Uncharacterized protein n=1 Tax=Sorghum bicolor TaxID=4558 RepID=A0A1B6P8D0_SORBI|nr:hypothetical protein SORBI_3009G134700 [Sorghum bicolor]